MAGARVVGPGALALVPGASVELLSVTHNKSTLGAPRAHGDRSHPDGRGLLLLGDAVDAPHRGER